MCGKIETTVKVTLEYVITVTILFQLEEEEKKIEDFYSIIQESVQRGKCQKSLGNGQWEMKMSLLKKNLTEILIIC